MQPEPNQRLDTRPQQGRAWILATIAAIVFVQVPGFAADSVLHNLQLCNDSSAGPASKIKGCTALIESGAPASTGLAIAYNNRGNAYVQQGQYELGLADYDHAISLNPGYARAFNNRGIALERQKNFDDAMENFDAAIALDPDYANAFAGRAELLARKGKYEQAQNDYDTALRLNPSLAEAWNGRCLLNTKMGATQAAVKDCDASLRISVTAAALDSRGFAHLQAKEWRQAVQDYDAALHLKPSLAISLYGRGLAKTELGDSSGAKADIQSAMAIDANVAARFSGK